MSMGREPELDVDTDGALETVDVDMGCGHGKWRRWMWIWEAILKRSKNPYMQAYLGNDTNVDSKYINSEFMHMRYVCIHVAVADTNANIVTF